MQKVCPKIRWCGPGKEQKGYQRGTHSKGFPFDAFFFPIFLFAQKDGAVGDISLSIYGSSEMLFQKENITREGTDRCLLAYGS